MIVGTPETDPLPPSADVNSVGPILGQRGNAVLPDWVAALSRDRPLIWVYSGDPRCANAPTAIESIVVIRAPIAALAGSAVQVVLTTGYQDVPPEFGTLPSSFHYLPDLALAERSDS